MPHNDKSYDNKQGSKGKPSVGSKSAPIPTGFKFINYTPTEADKTAIKSASSQHARWLEQITWATQDGYKLSLSFKHQGAVFTASLTGTDEQSPNYMYILTGRGASPDAALIWCAYLHLIRFEGAWLGNEDSNWDF